jgi:tellurium resistance protein TerZ
MSALNLSKGSTLNLSKALIDITMGLGWSPVRHGDDIDLDGSVGFFDAAGNLIDQVWFRQYNSKDSSTEHSGDNTTGEGDGDDEQIKTMLPNVDSRVKTMVYTVTSWTGQKFSDIKEAYCRLVDNGTGKEEVMISLTGSGNHTAMIVAKLTRNGNDWSITALNVPATAKKFHDLVPLIQQHI